MAKSIFILAMPYLRSPDGQTEINFINNKTIRSFSSSINSSFVFNSSFFQETADDDIRHLINAPEANEAIDESDSSLPGVVIPEESSSYFSSSFSSSKMGDSPDNWLSYRQIYNYLPGLREPQQEESSSSIVSWASLENSYNASETAETDEQ